MVVSIGFFVVENVFNIIVDFVWLIGMVRIFNEDVWNDVEKEIEWIV